MMLHRAKITALATLWLVAWFAIFVTPSRAQYVTTQTQCIVNVAAQGTSDAITSAQLPCGTTTNLVVLTAAAANVTTTPTYAPAGSSAKVIVRSNGVPLYPGDLQPNAVALLVGTGPSWILLNPFGMSIPNTVIASGDVLGNSTSAPSNPAPTPLGNIQFTATGGASSASVSNRSGHILNAVDDFGADPNGNIDSSDSTTQLQNALNASCVQPVSIPAGTFNFTYLTLACSGAKLIGAGTASTILVPTSTTGDAFTIGSATTVISGVEVAGFAIVPPSSTSRVSGADLAIYGTSGLHAHDIKLYWGFDGLDVYSNSGASTYGNWFNNMTVSAMSNADVALGSEMKPATAAWTTSSTTVNVTDCPINVSVGSPIWDMNLSPSGTQIGTYASCASGVLTLQSAASSASGGAADNLRFSVGAVADFFATNMETGSAPFGWLLANVNSGAHLKNIDATNNGYGMAMIPGQGQYIKVVYTDGFFGDTSSVFGTYVTNPRGLLISPTGTGLVANLSLNKFWAATTGHGVAGTNILIQGTPTTVEGITFVDLRDVNGGGIGFDLQGGSHILIQGQINENSSDTINGYPGLHVSAGVSDWSFIGNAGQGTQFGALNYQSYGAVVDPGASTNYTIMADLSGNQSGTISDGGTGQKAILVPGYTPYATKIGQSTLPFILGSSGTMGNNGALTLTTALSYTPANAYVYLPSGAISSGSVAGWYFAKFTTTTAATVYNNTYTSGTPVIPPSPTAFATTGPGSYTQTTGSVISAYQITVAGGALGINGAIDVEGSVSVDNATTGNKSWQLTYGGVLLGKNYLQNTNVSFGFHGGFTNRGATNAQVNLTGGNMTAQGGNSFGPYVASVDSTSSQVLALQLQLVVATDWIILEACHVMVIPSVN